MANSTLQKLLDAGVHYSDLTKKQADALAKSLSKSGDMRRKDAEQLVASLVERGRQTTERVAALVQSEVATQVADLRLRFEEIESKLEAMAFSVPHRQSSAPAQSAATEQPAPKKSSATQSSAKKAPTKKSSAKKAPAKKAPAKKSSARKAPAKKAAAKKAPAQKSGSSAATPVGSSGVRKVSTRKPA